MIVGGKDVGDRPLILAPMEEVTNPPFRKFCKRYGADWLYSEFVSADALVRSINKTVKKLTIEENERPVTIQIYGRFIDSMVEAAKIVEEVQPDFIDINFGCPVKRVAAKGAGAGMLRDVPLMVEMAKRVFAVTGIFTACTICLAISTIKGTSRSIPAPAPFAATRFTGQPKFISIKSG